MLIPWTVHELDYSLWDLPRWDPLGPEFVAGIGGTFSWNVSSKVFRNLTSFLWFFFSLEYILRRWNCRFSALKSSSALRSSALRASYFFKTSGSLDPFSSISFSIGVNFVFASFILSRRLSRVSAIRLLVRSWTKDCRKEAHHLSHHPID